mgnify:CR=1 FL=1
MSDSDMMSDSHLYVWQVRLPSGAAARDKLLVSASADSQKRGCMFRSAQGYATAIALSWYLVPVLDLYK